MTTKNSKSSKPSNFIVMTIAAIGEGGKVNDTLTNTGKAYATMRGYNYTGKRKEEQTNPSMFFDVKAYSKDDTVSPFVQEVADIAKGEKVTVKGRFGFRQWVSQSGIQKEALEIIASSVEEYDPKDKETRPSNFAMLTFKAHIKPDDVPMSFTQSGKSMAKVRAHLSMGKDGNGEYRPSFWCNILHVSKDENPDEVINAICDLKNGDYFTVKVNSCVRNGLARMQTATMFHAMVIPFGRTALSHSTGTMIALLLASRNNLSKISKANLHK